MYKLIIALLLAVTGLQAQDTTSVPTKTFPNFVRVTLVKSTPQHRNPYDSDGIKVKFPDGRVVKARFANFDGPEMKNTSFWNGCDTMQPYAVASRDFLAKLIDGKDILLDTLPFGGTKARKSYDRMICDPYTLDSNLITLTLLNEGCGWYVAGSLKRKDLTIPALLSGAFDSAKSDKKGLWGLKGVKHSPAWWKANHKNKPKQ